MSLKTFIGKKKNQQLILLVIAVILVYFWWKNRTKKIVTTTDFSKINYPNARVDNSNGGGGGGTTDPGKEEPEEPGEPGSYSYVPFFLDRSPADQLNIQITGEPGAWVINEGATPDFPLHAGYGFRYLLNGELITAMGNIQNIPWNSNEPLFIIKEHYKLSCNPTDPRVDEWIYDCAPDYLIAPFEAYNLGAFCNIIFKKTGEGSPVTDFVTVVPNWYVPHEFYAVTPEQAPNVEPLPGIIFASRPFSGRHTQDNMLAKGWTHASHSSISPGTNPPNSKKYHDAVRTMDIFASISHTIEPGSEPIGKRRVYTEADVRNRAREFGAMPIFVGESAENLEWDPKPIYITWFLDELKIKAIEAGFLNFKATKNYFWGFRPEVFVGDPWAHLDLNGLNSLRKLFQYPVSEWNARFPDYYAQISSSYKSGHENMSLEGWYEKPNMSGSVKKYMRLLYSLIIGKKFLDSVGANNATGVTLRAGYEVTGYDTEDPTEVNGGHLVSKGNMGICGNEQAAVAFMAIWFGGAFFHWNNNFNRNVDPAKRNDWAGDNRQYFVNASGVKVAPISGENKIVPGFPYEVESDSLSTWGPHTYFDFSRFGLEMAYQCKETMGGAEKWARFRINGGAWTTLTADDAEPINAVFRNGGVVRFRKKNNWVTFWYWNPIGANTNQTITIEDPDNPAITYTKTIFGNKVHLKHFQV